MSAAEKRATHEELRRQAERLEPPLVGEVIDGILHTMGRPRPAHQHVEGGIYIDLREGRRGGGPPPSGWLILPEVEVLFATLESAIPDLSGWRLERIKGHRDENPITVVPDWACEILSESTRKKDLGPKRDLYARHGVRWLWIIDPDAKQLDAFMLGDRSRWELLGSFFDDARIEAAPFADTPIEMGRWWPERDS